MTSSRFWPLFFAAISLMVIRCVIGMLFSSSSFKCLDSPFFHHNHLAMNLLFAIPILISHVYLDPRRRFFYLINLVIMVAGLALSGSRSGWIAALLVFIYFLWKLKQRNIIIFVFSLFIIFVTIIGLSSQHRSRFLNLVNFSKDSSLQCRLMMWQVSGYIIRDHPILGIGFSNQMFLKAEHEYSKELFYKGILKEPALYDPHPHNLYIQMLVYLGLGGYVILFWAFIVVKRSLEFIGENEKSKELFLVAVKASLVGFLIMNCADTIFNSAKTTLIFFLLLAYIFEWKKSYDQQK